MRAKRLAQVHVHDAVGTSPLGGAGGRVTGREVIAELVVELRASVQAAEQFEGEMRNLAAYAKALAQALDCIRSAGGNRYLPCMLISCPS